MNIKDDDEMLLLLSLNVSVPVLPSCSQGIFHFPRPKQLLLTDTIKYRFS